MSKQPSFTDSLVCINKTVSNVIVPCAIIVTIADDEFVMSDLLGCTIDNRVYLILC